MTKETFKASVRLMVLFGCLCSVSACTFFEKVEDKFLGMETQSGTSSLSTGLYDAGSSV